MVSSPTLPTTATSSRVRQFPLFSRLLRESESSGTNRGLDLVCPATAPIILPSMDDSRLGRHTTNMDKEQDSKLKRSEMLTLHSPIKLQDPPKTKLKRQLSVDTADRTEALRARKKAALVDNQTELESDTQHDEVDGECGVTRDLQIASSSHATSSVHVACKPRSIPDRLLSPETHDGIRMPDISDRRFPGEARGGLRIPEISDRRLPAEMHAGIPEISYSYEDSEFGCQPSPGNFNLSEICLTSPFNSTTPSNTKSSEKSIFVFPEPPRKLSPYKVPHDERDIHDTRSEYTRDHTNRLLSDSSYKKDHEDSNCGKSRVGSDGNSAHAHSPYKTISNKSHVSERGFIWPEKVTVTDPLTFSPRIVTSSESVGRKSTTSSNERIMRQEQQTLNSRLRMLERERDRTKEIYGCTSSELSPNSRGVESVRRGISYQDRSPNEKDIREINEEVRCQYERSMSYPRCSPRQIRTRVSKPSPLLGQAEGNSQENGYRDLFREDVRKRLFMTGEPGYSSGIRRQYSSMTSQTRQESTEIPAEVLQFLHSKNFHPEQLENLKDILRRGGSPHEDSQYLRSTSGQYGGDSGLHYRRVQGTSGLVLDEDSPRERRAGDIDVRMTVESITDKNDRKTEDILRELDHENKECKCANIEHEILLMAMDAYSKIRRTDRSVDAFEQFQAELNETHANVYTSMRVLCAIKCMCKYGRTLEDMFSGSIVFRLNCPNIDALLDLWHMYKSGDLLRQFKDAFISKELLEKFDCDDIELAVKLDWENYLVCKKELEMSHDSFILTSPTKSPLIPVHVRSRSEPASVSKQANRELKPPITLSPFRERFSSDSYVELSPRRAFQEINAETYAAHPASPSKKLAPDNVFVDDGTGSPLTSPRRRHFVLESQREQENLDAPEPVNV